MQSTSQSTIKTRHSVTALTPVEVEELLATKDREIVHLRRQVAWFQRQIFGQKSERRLPEPEGLQGTLGETFAAIPDKLPPNKKSKIAAHERERKGKNPSQAMMNRLCSLTKRKCRWKSSTFQSGHRGARPEGFRNHRRKSQPSSGATPRQLHHPQVCATRHQAARYANHLLPASASWRHRRQSRRCQLHRRDDGR